MMSKISKPIMNLFAALMLIVSVALGWVLLQPVPVARAANGGDYRAGEIVVQLVAGVAISVINSSYGTTVIKPLTSRTNAYLLQTANGQDAATVATAMAADVRVVFAHPNFISEPPEANPRTTKSWGGADPTPYLGQYAKNMLQLPTAQAINKGGGSVVAVIDTGVQANHPALQGKLTTARYDFIDGDTNPDDSENGIDDDGDGMTDEAAGHGTHVAGTILLVAPEAKILPIRVLDSDGIGDDVQIAQAIEFAVVNGANVINLSLGTAANSNLIDDTVRRATQAGVVVVSAAGNLNSKEKQYPAADNCAIAVTSISSSEVKSSFSNFGSWIDLSAPGESIESALPPSGYGQWSGTSMATPFVAGQAALIHSFRPQLNPYEIATLIAETAQSTADTNPDYGSDLGSGRLDIVASLNWLVRGDPIPEGGGTISSSCVEPGEPFATVTPTPSSTGAVPTVTRTPKGPTVTPSPTRTSLTPSPTVVMRPRAFLPLAQR